MARVAARVDRGRYGWLPFDDEAAQPLLAQLPEATRYASAHVVRRDGTIWTHRARRTASSPATAIASARSSRTALARAATPEESLCLIDTSLLGLASLCGSSEGCV